MCAAATATGNLVAELERTLRDLPRFGELVKDRGYRQVWRFEHAGKSYYLKFYPRRGSRLKRTVRGNPAMRELVRLQALQRAGIPSPRARNVLVGYRIRGELGDAILLDGIEPSVQLDAYLNDAALRGEPIANHRALVDQVIELVQQLARANLGHEDLHLGNFLLADGRLHLLDGYAVRRGGLRKSDLLMLGHGARRYATRTDILRGWRALTNSDAPPPPVKNRVSRRRFRKRVEQAMGQNAYFGRLFSGEWRGHFFMHEKFPRRWSDASRLRLEDRAWHDEWPRLLSRIEAELLEVIKSGPSGDVLAGEVELGGKPVSVIVKRPRRKYWYRHVNSIGRPSRATRTWIKAWKLIARDLPAEWPLIVMERRVLGYVTDSILVVERMRGERLDRIDLDAMDASSRRTLFRRLGRTLRQLEQLGFTHFDSKSSNWIIRPDEKLGPTPIMIDVDGVRHYVWSAFGIDRLLRSMREHPQYTPADSLELCLGYAPRGRADVEKGNADVEKGSADDAPLSS